MIPLISLLPAAMLWVVCQAVGPAVPAATPAAKLALLVGIDRYAPGTPDTFPKLSGCVADVRMVERALLERFGFPAEGILVLTDERATHEAIVRAFREHLVERAGADTEVLFWYSGHGSRVPDQSQVSAAEIDRKDSTFVAYDSRAQGENGANDVADDEVRSLLAALTAKTTRVTVVTDSCHSGGATRGVRKASAPRIRGVDDGARPVDRERLLASFWPKEIPLLDDADARMLEAPAYVHIAACSPRQVAQEIDAEGENGDLASHGALSFYLVKCLLEVQPRCSYRSLADDVAVALSTRYPEQNVWAEGSLSREVFGASFAPLPSGFRAQSLPSSKGPKDPGDVRVEAGSMHGLRVGSVLALFSADGERIGTANVVRLHAVHAVARWNEPAPAETPARALRAVEETRPAREEPLDLFVPDSRLAQLLSKSARVRVESATAGASSYALRAEADGTLAFLGPGGLVIWRQAGAAGLAEPVLLERIEAELREELRYRALIALADERGTLELAARFVPPSGEELAGFVNAERFERCSDARPRVESDGRGAPAGSVFRASGTRAPGQELSLAVLEVENRSGRGMHVAVLSVSEDRQRNVIWPGEGQQDRVLEAGAKVRVPVNVVSNPAWLEDRPMRDRYLVIGTVEPADFTPLARSDAMRSAASPVKMPAILALALERPETRGVRQASIDRSTFGLAVVDLFVDPPEGR